jgi:hypothetical protein
MNEIKINSWNEFADISNKLIQFMDDDNVIYRGQANSEWGLYSSFARMMKSEPKIRVLDSLHIEEDMLTYFSDRARLYKEIPTNREHLNVYDWWGFMQHYGAPTRMVDWSLSPYVALYFAVEDYYNKDGALFLYKTPPLSFVQRLANKIDFPVGVVNGKDQFIDFFVDQYNKQINNKPYTKCLLVTRGNNSTNRMFAQQSIHTVGTELLDSFDKQIEDLEIEHKVKKKEGEETLIKIIIPLKLKLEFQVNLNAMNINATTLFPGIEGLGKTTRKFVEQRIKSRIKTLEDIEKKRDGKTNS